MSLVHHDVTYDASAKLCEKFDSISAFYLLHCLSGNMHDKSAAIANLAACLKGNGVFYGATILGSVGVHNRFGRLLMRAYNQRGIFGNRDDTVSSLKAALGRQFGEVQVRLHGGVALFEARQPFVADVNSNDTFQQNTSAEADTHHVD